MFQSLVTPALSFLSCLGFNMLLPAFVTVAFFPGWSKREALWLIALVI